MAAYVTYSYYTTTYLGAAIASADFARLALRASAMIDRLTYNRAAAIILADTDDDTIDKIQMATCAVAETYGMLEKLPGQSGGEIASERAGNYSVTYVQNKSATMSDTAKMMESARIYLLDTDLLYPGFNEDEV